MCETAVVSNTIMTRVTGKHRHIGTALCALLVGASIASAAHGATDKEKNLFVFKGANGTSTEDGLVSDAKGSVYGTAYSGGTYCAHHARRMPPIDAVGLTSTSSAHFDPIKSVAVTWADLDLDSPAGIEVMHGRLEGAARQICGPEPLARDFNGHGYYSRCVTNTLHRAIDALPVGYAYNLGNGTTREVIAEK